MTNAGRLSFTRRHHVIRPGPEYQLLGLAILRNWFRDHGVSVECFMSLTSNALRNWCHNCHKCKRKSSHHKANLALS